MAADYDRREAELWATFAGLTGREPPPAGLERLASAADVATALHPRVDLDARAVTLDPDGRPTALFATVERPFETWHLVGLLNWSTTPALRGVHLADCGLEAGDEWIIHDFWGRGSLGTASHGVGRRLPGRSCLLLGLRARQDRPQLSGTARHVTMGGVELDDLRWDEETSTLIGVATEPIDVLLRVPHPFVPSVGEGAELGPLAEARLPLSLRGGGWSVTFRHDATPPTRSFPWTATRSSA